MTKTARQCHDGRCWRIAVVLATLLPLAAWFWQPAPAQSTTRPQPLQQTQFNVLKVASAPQQHAGVSLLLQAQQHGVRRCAPRIAQMQSWDRGVRRRWLIAPADAAVADRSLLGLAQVAVDRDGMHYTVAGMAPGQANGCGLGYQRVRYRPESCAWLRRRKYAPLAAQSLDHGRGFALSTAANELLVLMPAGEGCVTIRGKIAY